MAVAFDYAATGASGTGTWTHTASGTNRIVLVAIAWATASSYSLRGDTFSATYAGTPMTQAGIVWANNNYFNNCVLFYLLNPPTTANATVSVSTSGSIRAFAGSSVSYTGVSSVAAATPVYGTGATASISVTSAETHMAVAVFTDIRSTGVGTMTQTPRFNRGDSGTNTQVGVGLADAPGAATVPFAATLPASGSWGALGVNLVTAQNDWTGGATTSIGVTSTANGGASTSGGATTNITATAAAAGSRGVGSGATTPIVASTTAAGVRNTLGLATTTIVVTSVANGASGGSAITALGFSSTADGTVAKGGGATATFGFTATATGAISATGLATTTVVFTPTAAGARKTTGVATTTVTVTTTANGVAGEFGGATRAIQFTTTADGTTDGPAGTVQLSYSWVDADGGTPPWVHITLIPTPRPAATKAAATVAPNPIDLYSKTGAGHRHVEPGDYRCKVTFGDPATLRYDGAGWVNYTPISIATDTDLREALERTLT